MSWLLAFVGFAALIVLHELGHFAAAKAVGMRVERFCLFFGPMLFSFRRGETEYGVATIPLGGYVRITGMNPLEELPPEVAHRAYYRQAPWRRIVVILAGPAVNVLVAFLIFFGLFAFRGPDTARPVVAAVDAQYPAARVLQPGDRLVAVDGVRGDPAALRRQITSHRCAGRPALGCRAATPARITIVRGGRTTMTVTARPQGARGADEGIVPILGFNFLVRGEPLGVGEAAERSVEGMWEVTRLTVSAIGRIFVSQEAREQVSGVVGSYETTRQTIRQADYIRALEILALISLSLAIVNLFPFLPLDGGHVFLALGEKLRGRAIAFSVMERAGVIGFVLIIGLFLLGLTNDIDRLRGAGFGDR